MKRSLALALATTALVLPAGSSAATRDFVGITSDETFQQAGDFRLNNFKAMRRARIGLIRQVFDWSRIETSQGVYDLSFLDEYMSTLAGQGLSVMPVLTNAPQFYKLPGSKRGATRPSNNARMAEFAQALAERYGPHGTLWTERPYLRKVPITVWQIWNEPTLDVYWGPRPNARQYVAMLRTVGRAIEEVEPGAEIVSAGLPPSKLRTAAPLERYLKQMYSAGAARYFDTLAINAYARNAGELETLLRQIRKLMNSRRDRRAKIWITELGWASDGPRHRFRVGARRQAKNIRDSFKTVRRLRRSLRLRGLVYFGWRDGRPYAPLFEDEWGLHTGLLTVGGRRKPAYNAFVRGARSL
jgi:polysaccharide biosynthesis protein PslG